MLDGSRSSADGGLTEGDRSSSGAIREGPIGVLHILNSEGQATIVFRIVGSEHGLRLGNQDIVIDSNHLSKKGNPLVR